MDKSITVSIDLYIRRSVPSTTVNDTLDTLNTLKKQDIIDTFEVHTWPARVSVADYTDQSAALSRYERLHAWADRTGVSLTPAFSHQEREPLLDEVPETVLTLPAVCLAVNINEKLATVVPHTGEQTYTLGDALADLKYIPRDELEDTAHYHLVSHPLHPEDRPQAPAIMETVNEQ